MDLIRNFKLHALALLVVAVSDLIGTQKFGLVVLTVALRYGLGWHHQLAEIQYFE